MRYLSRVSVLPTVEGTYLESVYYLQQKVLIQSQCITYSRRYLSRVSVLPTVEGTYLESVYYLQQKVLIQSQYITYSRMWLAHPQFGEADSCISTDAKQCTAVNGASSKTYLRQRLAQRHLRQTRQQPRPPVSRMAREGGGGLACYNGEVQRQWGLGVVCFYFRYGNPVKSPVLWQVLIYTTKSTRVLCRRSPETTFATYMACGRSQLLHTH